ncbi:MAG: insulinase family protein, partial [Bacteroidetes bacterium]|nr:insulinase family protein [Bacteroidota bacterium]
ADLSKALKGKNTSLTPNMGQLTEGVNGSTTPKDIETLLQLIHLYFTDPRKDKDAFNSYITRQKQLYKNLASNPQFYYSGEYQKIMTQNNFRGGQLPKPEDLDKVDFDKAIQIYKERFADASDFTFFFIGSVDTTKLKPLLETYLGSLPSKNSKENFKDLGIRPPKGMVDKTVFKGTEPQSIVSITFTGPAKYDTKDAYALNCLADVMNIKLVEKLREEKGEVYGVGSEGMIAKYPYSNYNFSISFPCAPENIDTLTAAALAELKKIQQNGVTKEDLEKIKEQQKRKLEVDLKQNQFWMNALYEAYYLGNNPNAILTKEKQIEGLTSKMIQDAANKFINLKQYIRISLKPENITKEQKKPF